MLRPALRTNAAITAIGKMGEGAAIGTEAMALMPVDQRLGLTQNSGVGIGKKLGCGPHIAKLAQANQQPAHGRVFRRRRNVEGEQRPSIFQPQENTGRIRRRQAFAQRRVAEAGGFPCPPSGPVTKTFNCQWPQGQNQRFGPAAPRSRRNRSGIRWPVSSGFPEKCIIPCSF